MSLEKKFNLIDIIYSDEVNVLRPVIIAGIIFVYISAIFLSDPVKTSLGAISIFTILMAIHLLVHLFFNIIFKRKYWVYFVVQGIIIFTCAVIMFNGNQVILLGLIPIIICQSIVFYNVTLKLFITSIFFYSLFFSITIFLSGWQTLIHTFPILLFITMGLSIYSIIIIRQMKLRLHIQKVLKELEFAYEKVEELTLTNERQRMARDLHDTLSQGLAGIIMQLEAVDANLVKNNTKRAQQIVKQSMEHARKTLSDSRLVISDLRLQVNVTADINYAALLEKEIDNFKRISNTSLSVNINLKTQLPAKIFKHILHIVREALNNIVKHAIAKSAVIEITETSNQLNIDIADDGIGFNTKNLDHLFGHYGILGMSERVNEIQGTIEIESKKGFGTRIRISVPIGRGIIEENG